MSTKTAAGEKIKACLLAPGDVIRHEGQDVRIGTIITAAPTLLPGQVKLVCKAITGAVLEPVVKRGDELVTRTVAAGQTEPAPPTSAGRAQPKWPV